MIKLKVAILGETSKKEVEYFLSWVQRLLPVESCKIVRPKELFNEYRYSIDAFFDFVVQPSKTTRYLVLDKQAGRIVGAGYEAYADEEEGIGYNGKGGWVLFTRKAKKEAVALATVHELAHSLGLVRRHKDLHCRNRHCIMYPHIPAARFCRKCAAELKHFK